MGPSGSSKTSTIKYLIGVSRLKEFDAQNIDNQSINFDNIQHFDNAENDQIHNNMSVSTPLKYLKEALKRSFQYKFYK